jgi:hypothetical protein
MEWLNRYALAIQALAALGVFLLTGALVWATWSYVRLTKEQVSILTQQWSRQQPKVVFEVRTNGMSITAFCMNIGAPSVVIESIHLRLSSVQSEACLLENTWEYRDFLQPGKSWVRLLHDGTGATGLAKLPRRTIWEGLSNRLGPSQPTGTIEAEATFSCSGDPSVLKKEYAVKTSIWSTALEELAAS